MASLTNHYLQHYCERVGHSGPLPPATLPTLARLNWLQTSTIPFENLSLKVDAAARQHGINIDLPAVYKKCVVSRRGGCVEAGGGSTGGWHWSCLLARAATDSCASMPPPNLAG